MALQLFNTLMIDECARNRFKLWLKDLHAEPQIYNLLGENVCLTQGEFAVYFLNRLRAETLRYMEPSKCSCATLARLIDNKSDVPLCENITEDKEGTESGGIELSPLSEKYDEYFPVLGKQRKSVEMADKPLAKSAKMKKSSERSKRRMKPTSTGSSYSSRKDKCTSGSSVRQFDPQKLTFTHSELMESQQKLDREKTNLKLKRIHESIDQSGPFNAQLNVDIFASREPLGAKDVMEEINKEIFILSDIYSNLIDSNLVACISNEIKYILGLLLVRSSCDCKPLGSMEENTRLENVSCEIPVIFGNIKHCIIFAVDVLDKQFELLKSLDDYCLKMLSSNESIIIYSQKLSMKITEYYKERMINSINFDVQPSLLSRRLSLPDIITFQCETDKRKNFNSNKSFRLFCKQRDNFYKLYRKYKEFYNNDSVNWNAAQFKTDVCCLIDLCSDPVNLSHLSSLLVEQCILSCITQELEENQSVPLVIKDIDPAKLLQLNMRLVSADSVEDAVIAKEEYYFREFICAVSNNLLFINSLIQTLMQKITELTQETISLFEIGDVKSTELNIKVFTSFRTLLLLGRLLGECLFGHHEYNECTQEQIINSHSQTLQTVDLVMWLHKAISRGVLVITIPWIVESLLSLNSLYLAVPQLNATVQSLIRIYMTLNVNIDESCESMESEIQLYDLTLTKVENCAFGEIEMSHIKCREVHFTESTKLLIRLWISRLFKRCACSHYFSEEVFYKFLSSTVTKPKQPEDVCEMRTNPKLDCANVFNAFVIHKYCANLHNLKRLFTQVSNEIIPKFRHITPIKLSQPLCSENICVQMQLEESFFNVHKGLRSTIEFIVDRIASVCKILIGNDVIEVEKKSLIAILSLGNLPSEEEVIANFMKQIELGAHVIIDRQCQTAIPSVISTLLPYENASSIIKTCEKIAIRKLKHQITTWLDINVSGVAENIVKELLGEIKNKKSISIDLPQNNLEEKFNINAIFSRELLDMQDMLETVALKNGPMPENNEVIRVMTVICEYNIENLDKKMITYVYTLTWDFVIALVTNAPEVITDELLELLCAYWKKNVIGDIHKRVLCARNIHMAVKNNENKLVPVALAKLLYKLISNNILELSTLEDQGLALLSHIWTQVELQLIKRCFYHTRELLRETLISNERLSLLWWDWLTDTAGEIEAEYV